MYRVRQKKTDAPYIILREKSTALTFLFEKSCNFTQNFE